jgi:tRNA-splicing ligase RtcB (3'-phosphate/5'-hydroxy nucleic acid ligase)
MNVFTDDKIPIKIWAEEVEPEAMVQAHNLARLPFAFKHIAIMPDVHVGYGMPIGGVMATRGVVVPNAVGVN